VLSRTLAARHHFPAIEITSSASRVMHDIADREHQDIAAHIKMLLGVYQENFDYVQIGSYQAGTNPALDEAIRLMPAIERYLKQDRRELSTFRDSIANLHGIVSGSHRFEQDEDVNA
jgi:flagellum-specific ATP synthase